MNEVIDTILNRRTVREYIDKKIDDKIIEEIILAGNNAPTGLNLQPFRFVVIKDKKVIKELSIKSKIVYDDWFKSAPEIIQNIRNEMHKKYDDYILYDAPMLIFVIGKKIATYEKDCPMVIQSMMIAAKSLGLGSCWAEFGKFGIDDKFKEKFKLAEDEVIYGPIIFGYPNKDEDFTVQKKAPNFIYI